MYNLFTIPLVHPIARTMDIIAFEVIAVVVFVVLLCTIYRPDKVIKTDYSEKSFWYKLNKFGIMILLLLGCALCLYDLYEWMMISQIA